jgi:queuine tRNA-ribosyltransferase
VQVPLDSHRGNHHVTTARFELQRTQGVGRRGTLWTAHGSVETPAYVPLAKGGAVGSLRPVELTSLGAQAIAVSLYGLLQRPGAAVIESLGGLHAFLGWTGPLLTDPGDREVERIVAAPALDERRRTRGTTARVIAVEPEQVIYTSYIDGSRQRLSPSASIDDQRRLGADIARSPAPVLSHLSGAASHANDWMRAAAGAANGVPLILTADSLLTGIPSIAVLGWGVRGPGVSSTLPASAQSAQLRLVLGDDGPPSYLEAVRDGADLLQGDSATRMAEAGAAFTPNGHVSVLTRAMSGSQEPLDATCPCSVCGFATRGYLHHLFASEEMAGPTMLAYHNLAFLLRLERNVRDSIAEGAFAVRAAQFLANYEAGRGAGL